jgi:hypothetical protein
MITIIRNTWHLDSEAEERKFIKNKLNNSDFLQIFSIVIDSSMYFVKTFVT